MTVLSREMKQRVEELASYQEANRDDLAQNIQQQIDVLNQYMPKQLSETEVEDIVKATISEVGATSKADMER